MSGISSGVGLISGINYASLINQLVAIDEVPQNLVQSEINEANQQSAAYSTLATDLGGLQTIGSQLALPQTFQAATTSSSDPNVLTATAAEGAAVGSYQFQVAQLVTTQQTVSAGFANATSAPIGAGTITIEEGGGQASSQTQLSQLNGGQGVQRGEFRITDGSGNSAVINISDAVTLNDVISDINSAGNIGVQATLSNQGIVLTDTSGGSGALTVQDVGGGTTAESLGLAVPSTDGTLTGSAINYVGTDTQLGSLNDGRGVQTASTGADFQVNLSNGTNFDVTLGSAQTVGDVLNAINTAGGGKVTASIASNGQGLQITDNSGGVGPFSISALNGSQAATDLGIAQTASGTSINGSAIYAGNDSVLISSLNGGNGIPLGQISITDRAGISAPIDLSGAKSLSDIITDINNAGIDVNASLNSAGTGIQLTDSSGGTGNLVISDVNSTTAAALGIAGSYGTATQTVVGSNLHTQYISDNTALSSLGGGQGVNLGTFSIINSAGSSTTIDLAKGSINTVGDVINAINNAHDDVTASINSTGNGILLTDTAGGAGELTVKDITGSSAQDLNIAGTATGTTINGAFEKTITVSSSDTLSTVQSAINNLGFGVTAQIINDGSSTNPYRLSLTSLNSGSAGQFIIDPGTTNLAPTTIVQGQDAAVFLGGSGSSSQPLLVTSSTNTLSNVIKGVTISLTGASSQPVTLNVTPDPSGVVTSLQNFVTQFNALTSQIGTYTQFNTTTNQGSLLLGDETTQQIQEVLYNAINASISGNGQYDTLASIGITIGDNAQLNFNSTQFQTAFAADPAAVTTLFSQTEAGVNNTTTQTGLGSVISNAIDQLTDPVNGIVTLEQNTLSTRVQNYQTYYNELNTLVQEKQTQLENQFANLEETLSSLQSQQQVLSAFSGSTSSSAASSAASTPAASGSTSSSDSAGSSSTSGASSSG
jgi:flagellar hook-associated protein 2